MTAINDSLKHVAKSAELVKSYLEMNDIENEALLLTALDLLEKAIEAMAQST